MTQYTVHAPNEEFKGEVAGVVFRKGKALAEDGENGAALNYFRRRGYEVEVVEEPAPAAPVDPPAPVVEEPAPAAPVDPSAPVVEEPPAPEVTVEEPKAPAQKAVAKKAAKPAPKS